MDQMTNNGKQTFTFYLGSNPSYVQQQNTAHALGLVCKTHGSVNYSVTSIKIATSLS